MHQFNYRRGGDNRNFSRTDELRINFQIRVPQIRLSKDDEQLGIVSTDYGRQLADEAGLDLVEVVPNANPPICKIMDYGKFKYEKKIKEKESAKKQREAQTQHKEIRLRPSIAQADIDTKMNQARKFLQEGCKVQFVVMFKGRERQHQENGMVVIQKILDGLRDDCAIDVPPKYEGSRIVCCIGSKLRG